MRVFIHEDTFKDLARFGPTINLSYTHVQNSVKFLMSGSPLNPHSMLQTACDSLNFSLELSQQNSRPTQPNSRKSQ